MSNPYSSQSISGYNQSPPPNDGTQSTSNQLDWDKTKDKLSDPIKTLAESINTAVNSAFATVDDASNLTTGELPDARLSSNVALYDGDMASFSSGTLASARLPTVPIAKGGTNATTESAARTNLGVAIGSDVQAHDADLDAIAALAKTNGNFIVGNGSAWVAESGSTARSSLGLGSLATLSAVNNANWSGTDLAVANGGTGASDASGARSNLGIGSMATRDVTISTSAASGTPDDGEIWIQREA